MQCQTTTRGMPCWNRAAHFVAGKIVKPHYCCAEHAALWLADNNRGRFLRNERTDELEYVRDNPVAAIDLIPPP